MPAGKSKSTGRTRFICRAALAKQLNIPLSKKLGLWDIPAWIIDGLVKYENAVNEQIRLKKEGMKDG